MNAGYDEQQIADAIKQYREGTSIADICEELGVSVDTFYAWCSDCAGEEMNDAKRLAGLKAENSRLKKMVAEKALELEQLVNMLPDCRRPESGGGDTHDTESGLAAGSTAEDRLVDRNCRRSKNVKPG